MKSIIILFPHQLFDSHELLDRDLDIYLIEEYLYFRQYKFHKQKIAFHRATMKAYEEYLHSKGKNVFYIDAHHECADIRNIGKLLDREGVSEINYIDTTDFYLNQRIETLDQGYTLNRSESPLFINTIDDLSTFFRPDKKSFFQTTFYKQQRKKLNILLDDDEKPVGGKWTYDGENRKKYPKNKIPPAIYFPENCPIWTEAVAYTEKYFGEYYGQVSLERYYPITFKESKDWLEQFLTYRFFDFGIYEDAIVDDQIFLNHSVLSPLMNVGLITPQYIINRAIKYSEETDIPINSTEGFIRQIIGWREFIRGLYETKGVYSRTRNYWGFDRKIPKSFYDGTTGIEPIDSTIKKVLKTGYCHHIERLMLLGNFMLLCEFDPDEVYQWFMELFIDAYDWVMVPNVYGMCLFADGGVFATKPYLSGSNYVKKMSNYSKGPWCDVWDGLFWRFIENHRDFFAKNPRTSLYVRNLDKMSKERHDEIFSKAKLFIDQLNN